MIWHKLSNINTDERTATCSVCGPIKIYRNYSKTTLWRCSKHLNENSARYRRKGKETLKATCEICGNTSRMCWDHSHVTGKFRGTLCGNCNLAIGLFKDNPALCLQAAQYLKR